MSCLMLSSYKAEKISASHSKRFSHFIPDLDFYKVPSKRSTGKIRSVFEILNDIFNRDFIFSVVRENLFELYFSILFDHSFDFNIIRTSPILEFLYEYIDFLIHNPIHEEDNPGSILIACRIIDLFLNYNIYSPAEIASTKLIKTMRLFAESDDPVQQMAGASVFSFMAQPKQELPEYVKKRFLPLALTCRTSFNNDTSKKESLYFLNSIMRYFSNIPDDILNGIIELIENIIDDKNNQKIVPEALGCLQVMLLHYPNKYYQIISPFEIEFSLLKKITLLYKTNKAKILRKANHVLSVILSNEEYSNNDLTPLFSILPYQSLIENTNYSINPKFQKSSIWLLIDLTFRGSLCIEQLFQFNIISFINEVYLEQEISQKKLFFILMTNIIINCSPQRLFELFHSEVINILFDSFYIMPESQQITFLKSILQNTEVLIPMLDQEKLNDIPTLSIFSNMLELVNSNSKTISALAHIFVSYFPHDDV